MIFSITILLIHVFGVLLYKHQKPLEQKIWSERCKKNSVVLNDCNWCWCDVNQRYQCKARVCEEVDMFGHFKDAIQDIDVGMEGHGAWRSKPVSCTPGVHYERNGVLCVCDENGNWPNPVCRDLFRVLHSVQVTGQDKIVENGTCEPTKLYLIGCNVCFCPSSGSFNKELCTKKECNEDEEDIIEVRDDKKPVNRESQDLEVYATCDLNYKYNLDSMKCSCIRNNRLICVNITDMTDSKKQLGRKNYRSFCTGRVPGKIFHINCNSCHCDKELNIYCTAKKCLRFSNSKLNRKSKWSQNPNLREVNAPVDDESCIPGTKYKRDCNYCKCVKQNGIRVIDCSLMNCGKNNVIEEQKHDCVNGTFYEVDCMICYCYIVNNVKRQVCQVNSKCSNDLSETTLKGLLKRKKPKIDDLHGYCEPLHKYTKDCNNCRCLSDGKTLMCTSMLCIKRSSESLSVDVIPVYMDGKCPYGDSYKLDCNTCFCLSNGNAICTTVDCYNKYI